MNSRHFRPRHFVRALCPWTFLLGFAGVVCAGALPSLATETPPEPPLWLRSPAVSPDGTTIAFTYGGQIWRVPAAGGDAVPLTSGEFYSTRPVWSPDGTKLAFASKQHGNLDVFIMPVTGGTITRLTDHSADDTPSAFSPDGQRIYFSSPRLGGPQSILAGDYVGSDQLYSVPAAGGRTRLEIPTPALNASIDPAGKQLLYENRPIYENDWRKGGVSDGTHDIWLYDLAQKTHRQLTDFRGEDRNPVWAPDGSGYFFLSERSGSFNIWQSSLQPGTAPVAITTHRGVPVRFLSVARDGTLVYGLEGEIWRRPAAGGAAQRVPVIIRQSSLVRGSFSTDAADQVTELELSLDGRQLALIARGEVFVLSTTTGRTRRITHTAGHERQVSFAPDGRSVVYISERDGDMDIFEASLGDPAMKTFADPGPITEKKLIDTTGDLQYPKISPDGKRLAYLADRNRILVYDRATGTTVTALPAGQNYSYEDDDFSFCWSPDSRWLTATSGSIVTNQDIVLLDASGRAAPLPITRNGYSDEAPRFSPDGQAILWLSSREGLRQADASEGQLDVFIAHLTQASFDHARGLTPNPAPAPTDWLPQASGLSQRTQRLTPFSANIGVFTLTPDGQSLVFIVREPTGRGVGYKVPVSGGGLAQVFAKPALGPCAFDATADHLYSLAGSTVEITDLATGAVRPLHLDTSMAVDLRGELAYWFQHFWRLTRLKFYQPEMHGRDWEAIRARYARFLPHLHTWEDFAEMMSEMAGELNASHMGCYLLKQAPYADATASLGLYYDDTHTGPGARIAAVLPGGPADTAGSHLTPGAVILAVDGAMIDERTNIDRLLNRTADHPLQLRIQPVGEKPVVTQIVAPISAAQAAALSVEAWVQQRKALTEKLSGGRLGYVYIPEMSAEAYKRTYGEVTGDYRDKDGLVIDIRYNGGGLLHDQLIALFTGDVIANFTNRNNELVGRIPSGRWAKPTALVQNAAAYSDGSIFPHLYRRQKLGPIIGDRVPGTGTAVWWMYVMNNSLKWGVPQLGAKDLKTGWFENQETVPDHLVSNDPAAIAAGRDPQLETAVATLLKQLPQR